MKRGILILLVCLGCFKASGQNFEGDANEIADTIFNIRSRDSVVASTMSIDCWQGIYDSVLYAVIKNYLQKNIDKGKYSWPKWYFQQDFKEALRGYPDDNYKFLLKIKYHVDMGGVSNGCMWQHAFVIYDSLMMHAILDKYGIGFFEWSKRESDSLKKRGLGITLPYITNKKKTAQILSDSFRLNEESTRAMFGGTDPPALVLKFHGDAITWASWSKRDGVRGWFADYVSNDLVESIRKYKWTGPRFMNKPVDYNVYFDFDDLSLHPYPN